MKKSENIVVGISIGDLNGIGGEIVLKTFEDSRMLDFCTPVVFASAKAMSFFKKMMASVGIGAVKVDTVLNGMVSSPGGILEGVVHVKGGNVDQDIEDITIALMVDVKKK